MANSLLFREDPLAGAGRREWRQTAQHSLGFVSQLANHKTHVCIAPCSQTALPPPLLSHSGSAKQALWMLLHREGKCTSAPPPREAGSGPPTAAQLLHCRIKTGAQVCRLRGESGQWNRSLGRTACCAGVPGRRKYGLQGGLGEADRRNGLEHSWAKEYYGEYSFRSNNAVIITTANTRCNQVLSPVWAV